MKKLIFLLLILMLTGCAKETPPAQPPIDEGKYLEEATALYNDGIFTHALEKSLAIYENIDAQRIIADVTGAYRCSDRLFTQKVTLPYEVSDIVISDDGGRLIAETDTANYLIDYDRAEIIKELPGGEAVIKNNILFINGKGHSLDNGNVTDTVFEEISPDENALDYCAKEGINYKIYPDCITNDEWKLSYTLSEGYLNIFPLVHKMYDEKGDMVDYDSIIIANGSRLTAVDRLSGAVVFDTTLKSPILSCRAGDGVVIIACENMFSSDGSLFSNKAKSPLFPESDTLRLGNSYSFEKPQAAIAYSDKKIAACDKGTNEITLLYKVSYSHPLLTLEERYPTAICDNKSILAMGTYEYSEGKRNDYLILYDLKENTYTKTPIDHPIEKITYADGWQVTGDGKITAINGIAYRAPAYEININSVLEYNGKSISFQKDGVADNQGNLIGLGFELSDMSTISYADESTLFITEYEFSGKSVLFSLDDMKIKAEVENGIYFMEDAKAILYRKGSQLGIYEYLSPWELKEKGIDFIS